MPDLDLFGEATVPLSRKSNAGRPRVQLRTMIALLHLKHVQRHLPLESQIKYSAVVSEALSNASVLKGIEAEDASYESSTRLPGVDHSVANR
jgi:hypothetical protein